MEEEEQLQVEEAHLAAEALHTATVHHHMAEEGVTEHHLDILHAEGESRPFLLSNQKRLIFCKRA